MKNKKSTPPKSVKSGRAPKSPAKKLPPQEDPNMNKPKKGFPC